MSIGAILAVARFQLAGVTRRRGLWAWLALACMLASLALPPIDAGYVTVSVGSLRPLYTAETVGLVVGALGVTLLLPAHFIALRIAFPPTRHPLLLTNATPVSDSTFALGRWLADTAFLTSFLLCFGLGALFIQAVRAEAAVEQPLALLGPLLLVGVPSASLLAGFRGLVEARRWTRGPVLAGILMMVAWLIVLPLTTTVSRGMLGPVADPLGAGQPMHDMRATVPGDHSTSFGIHITRSIEGNFTWDGFDWTSGPYLAARGFWFLAGAGLALAAGLMGDRFRRSAHAGRTGGTAQPSGRASPPMVALSSVRPHQGTGLSVLLLAEIRLLRPGWKLLVAWFAGAIALALLSDGPDAMRRAVALLILPALFPLGDLGVRATGRSLLPLAMAVPASAGVRLMAGYLAGLVLIMMPLLLLVGTLVRSGSVPDPWLVAGPVLVPAVALLLGRLTGSGQAFSMLGLISCYMLFSA
jgi:hypothetical protein